MKVGNYEVDMVAKIAEVAAQKTLANRESATELAGKHAIKMVERIIEIVDSHMFSEDETLKEIKKIVYFGPVPPHI